MEIVSAPKVTGTSEISPSGILLCLFATTSVVRAGWSISQSNLSTKCLAIMLTPAPVSMIAFSASPPIMHCAYVAEVLDAFSSMLVTGTLKVTVGLVSCNPFRS